MGAEYLKKFNALCQRYHLSAIESALAFFKNLKVNLVIGVTSLAELREILAALTRVQNLSLDQDIFDGLSCVDDLLLNPSLWSKR